MRSVEARRSAFQKAHAATFALAYRTVCNQFDTLCGERLDELHHGIDIAANDPIARFHALDGWNRQPCQPCELPLVDTQQGASAAQLTGGYHGEVVEVIDWCSPAWFEDL